LNRLILLSKNTSQINHCNVLMHEVMSEVLQQQGELRVQIKVLQIIMGLQAYRGPWGILQPRLGSGHETSTTEESELCRIILLCWLWVRV